MEIKQEVAAARFLAFVGATGVAVGALLVITLSQWFWILFAATWPIMFFGLWGERVIKTGIEEKEAQKAASGSIKPSIKPDAKPDAKPGV